MKIAVIGAGHMGRNIIERLAPHFQLSIYDKNLALAEKLAAEFEATALPNWEQTLENELVVLVLPTKITFEVLHQFNNQERPVKLLNIATAALQSELAAQAAPHISITSAKLISHAVEMRRGAEPLVIVNQTPTQLVDPACMVMSKIGQVVVGNADDVTFINTTGAKLALEMAFKLEKQLTEAGITDKQILHSAIDQVATGTLRAYANGQLGPFAIDILTKLQEQYAGRK